MLDLMIFRMRGLQRMTIFSSIETVVFAAFLIFSLIQEKEVENEESQFDMKQLNISQVLHSIEPISPGI